MFAHFRRHRWLWVLIFGATIVSFVAFLGPMIGTAGLSGRGGGEGLVVGTNYGHTVSSKLYEETRTEARLDFYFKNGQWPDEVQGAQAYLQRSIGQRLVLLEQLKNYGIRVSDQTKADWIHDSFRDPSTGVFNANAYNRFKGADLPQGRIRQIDFERFVEHQVGIQHLISLVGAGGLVTPQEAELRYRREYEEVDTEIAFLAVTNFTTQLTNELKIEDVSAFYTNNQSRYRVPEKRQIRFTRFDATNFVAEGAQLLAGSTNIEAAVEQTYIQKGTNSFLDENQKPLSADAAKEQIRADFRRQAQLVSAQKKAIDYANELFAKPMSPGLFRTFAESNGIPTLVTQPFGEFENPSEIEAPPGLASAAFKLTEEKPIFEQPIAGENAIFLIALEGIVPSHIQPMPEILDQLYTDYRRSLAEQLCNQAGTNLFMAITNGVASGKTFESMVGTNAEYLDLPKFSRQTSTLPELGNRLPVGILQNMAFRLLPGETTHYTAAPTGGFILRLQAKVPVSDERVKEALPAYAEAQKRQAFTESVNAWFTKEMQAANPILPGTDRYGN